ncbi:ATP-dependent DNA helicase RecG [Kiloniella sp. b19]|uniref:ATP-dependent DNA helicase RecG n=1 Tax=Kiloniella sp. GXU_MW_B19 TaxID=3141326 RepID=UPI0031D16DC2
MRPEILFPLFAELTTVPGIGPRFTRLYEKLAGPKIIDLCWHLPVSLVDRRYAPTLHDAQPDRIATLTVTVHDHYPPANRRTPYRVVCSDNTGQIELTFFHVKGDYLARLLPIGETRVISGKVERYGNRLQMTHPDHVVTPDKQDEIKRVEPVYPLTAGVTNKPLSKAISHAVSLCPEMPDWMDRGIMQKEKWPGWKEALLKAHNPDSEDALHPLAPARQRLAYDELLANQLALTLIRQAQTARKGRAIKGNGQLREKARALLPFDLTNSQEEAVAEITGDMEGPNQMLRLLQGDVGSGKTAVALLSMLAAIETGAQAALLAPTEILARQHMESLGPIADELGLKAVLLTGRDKGKARKAILEQIEDGSANMVIGTHALFQDDVNYQDLALAVVDEQHRFGVHQRLALAAKGKSKDPLSGQVAALDMLVMTATPIPRTLTLTAYGDMDVSRLTEKPPGRKPVDTRTVSSDRMEDIIHAIGRALQSGTKVYWVCPLVEDSEKSDLAAAEERFEALQSHFGDKAGLVHGKMKARDKDAVMEAFAKGAVDLLVATTVIEVGVNVPEATIMIVEHAERFGLAQLHQLRGRIGRGADKSTCILLYHAPLSETARERLSIMRDSEDGFVIAEKDLELRGAGELLGTRQSGMPEFKLADLAFHKELLPMARDDARLILHNDPDLQSERGQALRTLLYLFERDATVSYLKSG